MLTDNANKGDNKTMQQALLKLEKQIDNLLKEKSDLQARIEELERENTGYQDRLEQAYKDDEAKADLLRKLDEPIMKLQAENEKLKEVIKEQIVTNKNNIKKVIDISSKTISDLQQRLDTLEQENISLKERLNGK